MAGGATATVTVSVDKERMKAYDAYGKGTYILEAGDYRFAVGHDAHDALNNILECKGVNAEQKARMVGTGDARMAHPHNGS